MEMDKGLTRSQRAGAIITMAVVLCLFSAVTFAAPSAIVIQGKLADGSGKPLTGLRQYRVQFYDAETGGNALGAPTTGTITLPASGRFSFEVVPPPEALAAASCYYELAIDSAASPDGSIDVGDIFPNRVRVNSVMYAQKLSRDGAGSGLNADLLDGLHGADFVTSAAQAAALAGKADIAHSHNLQDLGGAVTDAQVPDDITINRAANADRATSALFADTAAQADRATTALFADTATTASAADQAAHSDNATFAIVAGQADWATTALAALNAAHSDNASTAQFAIAADNANYAASAFYATQAGSANLLYGHSWGEFSLTSHTHSITSLTGQITNAQVPADLIVPDANHASLADYSTYATDADHLGARLPSDYSLATHNHSITSLTGQITSAQVPADLIVPEHDTLDTVTSRGAVTSQSIHIASTDWAWDMNTGALSVVGGVGIGGNFFVNNWAQINGQINAGANIYAEGNIYHNAGKKVFTWEEATTTGIEMAPNTGYMVTCADTAVFTLPSWLMSAGDIVRLNGVGTGGWKIAQYGGQKISLDGLNIPAHNDVWASRGPNEQWTSIASSADGTKLAACTFYGKVYTSSDSGASWTLKLDSPEYFLAIASSADGAHLIAGENLGTGYILISSDSGTNWTAAMTDMSRPWQAVASSADGAKLAACAYPGHMFTSVDSGANWTESLTDANRNWRCLASSANGAALAAGVSPGHIWISVDSGASWTETMTDMDRGWGSIASSADGKKLVAYGYEAPYHIVFTSNDSGATWITRMKTSAALLSVACSADGTKLAVGADTGHVFMSSDSGITWIERMTDSDRIWPGCAFSADGMKLAACTGYYSAGPIYTSSAYPMSETTLGISGYLSGGKGSAVELQYIGGDTFMPLSHNGSLGAK
ncbi:MAG: hypothetical protein NTX50_11485 [Candidatus Sumerlaeota bacterium]|nr:hypothetical protein [Candidatus Sumerlaeota bacterium]